MRFEYYHAGLDSVPKLSIDGTVDNAIHFSHWAGNETPAAVKADTSTEIALNLVGSTDREELMKGVELVTNNHFDTDGVLSVWTVLAGERALDLRAELIAAAEAGDFSEFTGENGVRASIVIQGSDDPVDEAGSPLARHLSGGASFNDARAYELVLPEVERVIRQTSDYEFLWRDVWERIEAAMESFERGASRVEEYADEKLSLITLAPDVHSSSGFKPTKHGAPFTAISRYARGELYLITKPLADGWSYRMDFPYYSWAETIVRPRVVRRDFSGLVAKLNELEGGASGGLWQVDKSELSSAIKFAREDGSPAQSSLAPERVVAETREALRNVAEPSAVGA
ncbi:MAG: hypothetical protein JOZ52_07595 [Acidobacteria bacterium]|nr:hypothetical protein [Acidobacteriota bacterium]